MIRARRMVMLAAILLAGCTPPTRTRREFELRKQSYQTLKFDSATAVVVVMHRSEDVADWRVWTGVLELGGPVETVRGDTLIIEPHYVIKTRRTPSGGLEIVRINDARALPDLVFVPAGPGFRLVPSSHRGRRDSHAMFFVVLATVAIDLYIRWPRG
jgi:hypothetical protein